MDNSARYTGVWEYLERIGGLLTDHELPKILNALKLVRNQAYEKQDKSPMQGAELEGHRAK